MVEPRDPFRALCAAIYAFHRELHDTGMRTSLVINLHPPDFRSVIYNADPMFGAERQPDGSLRVMDAVIRERVLRE